MLVLIRTIFLLLYKIFYLQEYKEIEEIKFRFEKKDSSFEFVKTISRSLQHIRDMNYILRIDTTVVYERFFIEKILNDFLSQLHMRICIIAGKFKNFTDYFEDIGIFRYRQEKVSAKTCAKWLNNASAELNLPACNEFLPAMIYRKPCEQNVITSIKFS